MVLDALTDTTILIDLLRSHPPALQWRTTNPNLIVGMASIVALEVIQGAMNKVDQQRAENLVSQFSLVYLTEDDQVWALRQLHAYHLSHNVGLLDCLIAAPAFRLQLPLYTRNLKHFTPLLGSLAQQPY